MIWVILIVLAGLVGAYLLHPFLADGSEKAEAQLSEVKAQRTAIELDEAEERLTEEAATQAKNALDRRLLALLDAPTSTLSTRLKSMALYLVPAVILIGGVGLYSQVGSPGFQPMTVAEFQARQAAELPETLEEFVIELEARIANNPNPPAEAYVVLARAYLRLGEIERGLRTYDQAVQVSDGDPEIASEREEVIRILRARVAPPQIDSDAAAAIRDMAPDEQAAMIQNMVEGLAVRLEQDPGDLEGWMRLIRSRAVVGAVDQARQDLQTALGHFGSDTPEGETLTALAAGLLPDPETTSGNE